MAIPNDGSFKIAELIKSSGILKEIADFQKQWPSNTRKKPQTVGKRDKMSDHFDPNMFLGTILTSKNCLGDVQKQGVRVHHLPDDQLLSIPAGLAIHPFDPHRSEAVHDVEIAALYRKAAKMRYSEILETVERPGTRKEKRVEIEARSEELGPSEVPLWDNESYYGENPEDQERIAYVFALLSRCLSLNCDVRDVGFLVSGKDNARLSDGAWRDSMTSSSVDRLKPQLKGYSLDMIAALNYEACGNWDIGGWIRAFGVGCGVLPDKATKLKMEWRFTNVLPTESQLQAIHNVHQRIGVELSGLCLNLLAMFGILHLIKNCAFKAGDLNMNRVCRSYISALRTMVSDDITGEMTSDHMEAACRTAAQPFGLGQTYWLAKAMSTISALTAPLRLRLDDAAPPGVQRLLIVNDTARQWEVVRVGRLINQLHKGRLEIIRREIEAIRGNPPGYSDLWEMYGCGERREVSAEAKEATGVLMPIVCGYARAVSRDDAMCFQSVERDAKFVTQTYTDLWRRYMENVDSGGLEKLIRGSSASSGK